MPGLYLGYFLQDLHIRRQPNHKPAGALAKTRDADYKSMKPYIDIAEKAKSDAMDAMEAALNK